jgi:uncharacterized phage protein (TIGR02218 family)
MTSKSNYGPYNVSQGGVSSIVADPVINRVSGTSGATEPNWPASEYATVVDGGITWTAVLARATQGTVTGVINPAVFQHDKTAYPTHYFQYGIVKWLTGANAGFTCDVRDSLGPVAQGGGMTKPYIYMLEMAPNPVQVGDTFKAIVGCAKNRLACQYFNNFDNFRGFPDMPTEERAIQTPNISAQGWAPKQTK